MASSTHETLLGSTDGSCEALPVREHCLIFIFLASTVAGFSGCLSITLRGPVPWDLGWSLPIVMAQRPGRSPIRKRVCAETKPKCQKFYVAVCAPSG